MFIHSCGAMGMLDRDIPEVLSLPTTPNEVTKSHLIDVWQSLLWITTSSLCTPCYDYPIATSGKSEARFGRNLDWDATQDDGRYPRWDVLTIGGPKPQGLPLHSLSHTLRQ